MLAEQVVQSFRDAAALVGILVTYQDPDNGVSFDVTAIPQETDWEGLGTFAAADSGRTRTWLVLREDIPVIPEVGHLITERTPADTSAMYSARSGTYAVAPLSGGRPYELIPPSEVLMRIFGRLHEDTPIG